ncbi:MAG: hypothetical protein AAB460_01595 [Patescibacteria group bacterium]
MLFLGSEAALAHGPKKPVRRAKPVAEAIVRQETPQTILAPILDNITAQETIENVVTLIENPQAKVAIQEAVDEVMAQHPNMIVVAEAKPVGQDLQENNAEDAEEEVGVHEGPFWERHHIEGVDANGGIIIKLDDLAGWHASIPLGEEGELTIGGGNTDDDIHIETGFEVGKPIVLGMRPGARVVFSQKGKAQFALTLSGSTKGGLYVRGGMNVGKIGGHDEGEVGHTLHVAEGHEEEKDIKDTHEGEAHEEGGRQSLTEMVSIELEKVGDRFSIAGGLDHGGLYVIPRLTIRSDGKVQVRVEGVARAGAHGKSAAAALRISF